MELWNFSLKIKISFIAKVKNLNKTIIMKYYFFVHQILSLNVCFSQSVTSSNNDTTKTKIIKPEIFNSGFIDIINNGQVNASARLLRLFIGEQGKFAIPLSFYGGVSSNNFQNQINNGQLTNSNDHLVNQYINPLSGLINISVENVVYFKKTEKVTNSALLYQVGERVLNGTKIGDITNPQTGKQTNFLNTFASLGLYFQTGAWEKSDSNNLGVFWIASRYHF